MCSLKVEYLKTYRNQAVIDVIGKGHKFRRIPQKTGTLVAIKDYLKATANRTDPDHPLFQTLGKHGPYEERDLTPKAVDCLIKSAVKKGSHPEEDSPSCDEAHLHYYPLRQRE
jgi:site-specific recombinase XerC